MNPVSLLSTTDSVQLGGWRRISTRNLIPAPVEVYNEENNSWSVEELGHIPPNNLGAVEIEGRVYFTNFQLTVGFEYHQRRI